MIGTIDIGGTKTITGLVENGQILTQEQFPTLTQNWQAHFENVAARLEEQCKNRRVQPSLLDGIGISLPGMVNSNRGLLLLAPYAGWKNIPVRDWFRKRMGIPRVFVENDVNACAVGEWVLGHGKGMQDFLWVTVSTGVGGAVMANGQLVHGHSQVAGEIGHLKVEHKKPQMCSCGQRGCLEAHASGTAISREFLRYLEENPKINKFCEQKNISKDARGCRILADAGEPGAIRIFEEAAQYLGRGLAAAINLLNPEAIFIGGGVGRSLDILIPGIRKTVEEETVAPARSIPILYTKLGYEAAFLGASCLPDFQRRKQDDF